MRQHCINVFWTKREAAQPNWAGAREKLKPWKTDKKTEKWFGGAAIANSLGTPAPESLPGTPKLDIVIRV